MTQALSNTGKLNVEIVERTALITIDNPSANTWAYESLSGLKALVEEVVAKGQSLEKALALAAKAGTQSPVSVGIYQQLIHSAPDVVSNPALPKEHGACVDLSATEDQAEGVQACPEKRAPVWKNP